MQLELKRKHKAFQEFCILLVFYLLLSSECASSYSLFIYALRFPDKGGKVRGKGET